MAHLQPPILPQRIYRYRSLGRRSSALDQEIDSIRNRYLYCSDFRRMNDPMEGFFESTAALRANKIYREAIRQIKDNKSRFGLACFSETHTNVLMWAHYADNFEGMCIEYSSRELLVGLPREASLVRIAYVDDLPEISLNEARNPGDAAVYILSQKQSNWSYEREWRVLAELGEVSVGLEQPVTAIYFGNRTPNSHRQRVLSRIQGTGVKAYMMEVDGYKPSFVPINDAAKSGMRQRKRTVVAKVQG